MEYDVQGFAQESWHFRCFVWSDGKPLAFAQTDENSSIDENQGITADEQPMDSQGTGSSESSSTTNTTNDLTHDEGDNASDMEPQSSSHSDDADYDEDELIEENSGS